MPTELIQVYTADNLKLSGLFFRGEKDKPVVIYLHGFEGDFFTHKWISMIGEKLVSEGKSFLSIQTRGTAISSVLQTKSGVWKYLGSHYEKLEESDLDIDAWVNFLIEEGYENIILSGHSLGTYKAIYYLFSDSKYKNKIQKLLLLCPFDKNWLLKNAAKEINSNVEELIKKAEEKVVEGKSDEIAPYGFDDVPHSYANFLSWARNDDLGKVFDFHDKEYDFPILQKISIPTKVICGTKDEFIHPANPENPEVAMEILQNKIPNVETKFIENAGHSFWGFEEEMVEEVNKFVP